MGLFPLFPINGSPGTPTRTTFGGTVAYTCNTGYVDLLSGSATVAVTCQAIYNYSGSWSSLQYQNSCYYIDLGAVILCVSLHLHVAVPCGDPLTIPNASRTFTGTTYLDTATYTCNTGYQLSGAATVTCQASGSWSTIPSCSRKILNCCYYTKNRSSHIDAMQLSLNSRDSPRFRGS